MTCFLFVFKILTWTCASRHNGVHFFIISTSKSAPEHGVFCTFWLRNLLRTALGMVCFAHFDSKCASRHNGVHIFLPHLNFQKCSEPGVFCTFWFRNLLRATAACNFSSLIQMAPAALASLLFDPPEPQIIVKTQCFVTLLLPFRTPASSVFCLFLFSDLLSSSLLFSSLTLPTSAFSSVHLVGSLTSKLLAACHAKSIFADSLQTSHARNSFLKMLENITFCSLLPGCRIPCACHTERRFNAQKWREHVVF